MAVKHHHTKRDSHQFHPQGLSYWLRFLNHPWGLTRFGLPDAQASTLLISSHSLLIPKTKIVLFNLHSRYLLRCFPVVHAKLPHCLTSWRASISSFHTLVNNPETINPASWVGYGHGYDNIIFRYLNEKTIPKQ
jgi:hypothetical protein